MLIPFADNIWIAQGTTLSVAGFKYPTRCAVIRLGGGGLLVWSPISLTPELCAEVDALGRVEALIAPNHLHHMFMSDWVTAYPQAAVFLAPRLAAKRPDLTMTAELGEASPWPDDIALVRVETAITTEVVLLHRASSTALFCDLLQQFPEGYHKGWRGIVARLDLMVGDGPSVPRKFRLAFRDKSAGRAAIARILDWQVERVLMAHGRPVRRNGTKTLAAAFHWLMR